MRSVQNFALRISRYLTSDDKGAVAVVIAIVIALLVGFVGLAVDLSRIFTANTEHQSHADAVVLAGASQLDGQLDAIDRATAAIQNSLVRNVQSVDGGADVQIAQIRFMSFLPDDDQPITATHLTVDPTSAECVEVTTTTADVNNQFITTVGGPGTSAVNAVSVACATTAICDMPPMMFCNPAEADPAYGICTSHIGIDPGQQIRAKFQGGGAQWNPGGFGYLDPPSGSQSAKAIAENLGSANPQTGCIKDTVDIRPGQIASAMSGINVRFDMYNNPFAKNMKNDWEFRPAKNVTKGFMQTGGTVCDTQIDTALPPMAMGMPRDSNIMADPNARFGNASWNRNAYWDFNHPGVPMPAQLANASRYKFYRYEIDNAMIPDNSLAAPAGEDGKAICHNDAISANDQPDRRTMVFAVVNCLCNTIQGNESDVPVVGWMRTFMTEPVSDPGGGMEYYFEFVEELKPGNDGGMVHTIIEIKR